MFPNVSENHPIRKDRTCVECGEYKRYTEYSFAKSSVSAEGYAGYPRCKPCHSAWKNKAHIRRTYGLEWDEYLDLMNKQCGKCALCGSEGSGKDTRLVVDHCHETGRVRGLLCWSCNVGIGLFKEDPDLLNKVIDYIRKD